MEKSFLGRTVVFPFRLENGRVAMVQDADRIKQSLIEYISEPFGTRFMEGQVGSKIKSLLFEKNNEVLQSLLKTFIYEACLQESNVRVVNIDVYGDIEKVSARITYKIVQSNVIDSLVYEVNLSK